MTKKQGHSSTGTSARRIRQYLREVEGLKPGEDLFFLAQALAFLIHDTPADITNAALRSSARDRFALRKLKASINLLEKFNELHFKPVVDIDSK